MDVFEAAALGHASRVREALGEAPELVNATTDDGFTALHLVAFFSGDVESARALLDAVADPDAPATNETGLRPINSAAAASSTGIVSLLLEAGADVNAAQHGGYTPLHSAAAHCDGELLEVLLGARADPALRTDAGRTPAELADERGHPEVARQLAELEPE